MIYHNNEPVRVVTMACGYRYRLRPISSVLECGSVIPSRDSSTMTRDQLRQAVRKHYLEGK